ncbi:MAG TPA: galactose oxidase early set domain-containing protein [Planctomycetota bacterium]|nr:galactose oxidase early set domain-containing protein [Planctomycetota bacterium]
MAPQPVHPDSHSISNPTLWITENWPPLLQPLHVPGQRMNTVHVCLIPAGVHRGEVLVWDGNLTNYGVRTHQPWAIVNPYWPAANPNHWPGQPTTQYRFHNALLPMPPGQGELFCAGQCWMPDGRLLVCGGTKSYPQQSSLPHFEGTRFVYLWDHQAQPGDPFGQWYQMPDLETPRWYPSVLFDGTLDNRGIVIGGTHGTPSGPPFEVNSYEVVRPAFNSLPYPALSDPPFDRKLQSAPPVWNPWLPWSDRQYWGPAPPYPIFGDYPRIHALGVLDAIAGGMAPRLFVSGHHAWGIHWAHDATQDPVFGEFPAGVGFDLGQVGVNTDEEVHYATSLLVPNPIGHISSHVARVGGLRHHLTNGPSNVVDTASITTPGAWSTNGEVSIPPLHHARYLANVVMLPNGDWFAVGGESAPGNQIPELFDGTQWTDMAPHAGPRGYHSAAILLPDARVFVCGGENRSDPLSPGPDYLIWEPPYFHLSHGSVPAAGITVRNVWTSQVVQQDVIGQGMEYGQTYRAEWTNALEPGIWLDRVVLMRPAAMTHHDDGGQRLVRLEAWQDATPNTVVFHSPASVLHAPPGWWMLFLVNSMGRPSQAYWVNLR